MDVPRITFEQWRALLAVVDAGGYAQAARRLHKSQSAVTYAVQKLQRQLGVQVFELMGRKAELTLTGKFLAARARTLLDEASHAEQAARRMARGVEAELRVAVEILFPNDVLLMALAAYGAEQPQSHIEVIESVLGGTPEALQSGRADVAITPRVPPGFAGDLLVRIRMLAAASPDHALHQLGRALTLRDLRGHRHLLVRDSSQQRDDDDRAMSVRQRWTVSSMSTSIEAACRGYGFAWYPEDRVRELLAEHKLKELPLQSGGERYFDLYLVIADPDSAGAGVTRFVELLREAVRVQCPGADARAPGSP